MGTGLSGSTITNKATVAFSRSRRNASMDVILRRFSSLVRSFLWWAGRDLNPRPSPCEGDVRSVQPYAYQAGLPALRDGIGRRLYFIFQNEKKSDGVLLAEKSDICALRVFFYEPKQGDASSPCFLYFHQCSWRELERCDGKFLLGDA